MGEIRSPVPGVDPQPVLGQPLVVTCGCSTLPASGCCCCAEVLCLSPQDAGPGLFSGDVSEGGSVPSAAAEKEAEGLGSSLPTGLAP